MKKVRKFLAMAVLLVVTTAGWAQTPTPTPPPTVSISGTVTYCSNPTLPPLPGATMKLTGTSGGSTTTDAAGNYSFTGLPFGGSYTVTPTKAALPPGSTGINAADVIALLKYHMPGPIPTLIGCPLMAADVNGSGTINQADIIAIQRFSLGLSTGIANVGKYQFTPANRTYSGVVSDQTGQNYDTLVFGDVASPFVE